MPEAHSFPEVAAKAGRWTLLVWVSGLLITAALSWQVNRLNGQLLQNRFDTQVNGIASQIEQRFQQPIYGLMGARAMYAGMEGRVNRDAFQRYVGSRDLTREFPGVRGIGFIERVPQNGLDAFVSRERADGMPDFTVKSPPGGGVDARDHYVIKYIYPLAANRQAVGLDVGDEPVRREGAERAARSGQPAMTGVIRLVQDNRSRPGFLVYVPVYRQGLPLNTEPQRLDALLGLTYSPIVLDELIQPALALLRAGGVQFQLSLPETGEVLYASGARPESPRLSASRPLEMAGTTLLLQTHSTPSLEALANPAWTGAVALVGGVLSTLAALVVWLLATGRARAVAEAERLTAESRRLALVAEHTANLVVMTDPVGRIEWVNDSFVRQMGYTLAEVKGRPVHEVLHSPNADPASEARLQQAIAAGESCRIDILHRSRGGRDFLADTDLQPLRDAQGRLTGFVKVALDVSALHHARERLDYILRGTHVGTWEWHVPSGRTVFNERWAEIIGYTLAELEPISIETWMRVAHPDDLARSGDRLQRHFAGELPFYDCEARMRHKDGHWVWVHDRGQVATWEADGKPGWMYGTHEDISERKAIEHALQSREALLQRMGQMASVGAWRVDLATGVPEWSPQTCRIHDRPEGYRPTMEEALNYYAPEARPVITELVQRGLQDGTPWDVELPMITATGRPIWVRALGEVERQDGQPVALVGAFQDVTARHQALKAMERYQAIIEGASDSFYMVDLDDGVRMILVNEAAVQHFGASRETIYSWHLPDWDPSFTPADVPALVEQIRQARNMVIQSRHRVRGGTIVPVEISINHYVDENGRNLCFGWFRDITQRLETERLQAEAKDRAEAASQAKSAFLATMSHEIRTPMNAVLGMLQLLERTELQPQQRDYVKKTEGAARSLLGIINDILDFSKIEAGKLALDAQPTDVAAVLHDLSVIFSASVGTKPVEVLFDIDPALPRRWVVDAMRLQQILINQGGNAIKFTERGEVVVSVRVLGAGPAPDQRWVRFAVRDTGIGIAPEHQEKIFAGFTQAESSTTRRFGGTGLGLVISRRLIELMGGRLELDSAAGRGSEFRFDLPLTLLDTADADATQAPAVPPGLPVLVVDDNPVARELIGGMGQSFGWDVTTAESGEAALALIEQRRAAGLPPFAAYLMDWQMPGLDGWQTAARIRSQPAADGTPASPPPVIMMITAHGRELLSRQTPEVQSLIDGYLVKPVTASMIFDALQNVLQPGRAAPANASAGQVSRPLAGLRLLVVEDNAVNQQVAEELLSGQGAAVDIAEHGLAGVEAVRAALQSGRPYDAVLMDMQMPVMDGVAATRALRAVPALADLPIIAMTANAMASDRETCLAAGMNDHIGKPFELQRLVATLLQWTRGLQAPNPAEAASAAPAAASGTQPVPVLDREGALARVGGSASLLDRLCARFLDDLPLLLHVCDAAAGAQDTSALQRGLHTLKGAAATIGADQLAAAARAAEADCKAGTLPDLQPLHDAVAAAQSALRGLGVERPPAVDADRAEADPPSTAQRERLARLLPLLEASDMEAFEVMEEIVAQEPAATADRWRALDDAVQNMDFAGAAGQVHSLLAIPA